MPWVIARFDGGQLVLGQLTRRHPRVQVRQVLGPAQDGIHPSATRIVGLGRLATWAVQRGLRRRLGRAVEARSHGQELVLHMGIPSDAVQSDELRLLMQHAHRFEWPYILYSDGKVVVHLRSRPGTDVEDLLRRLPGLDAEIVPVVDLSPWGGLIPAIPDAVVTHTSPRTQ